VEVSRFAVHKHEGRLLLVSYVTGHQAALRSWMSELATSDDVESVSED
jgi:hypothetical protein